MFLFERRCRREDTYRRIYLEIYEIMKLKKNEQKLDYQIEY